MNNERNFKGVWVPKEIWLSRELTPLEKLYLVEIDSLDDEINGCYATNKHFEMMFGQKSANVTRIITNLKEKGWIDISYSYIGKEIDKRIDKIAVINDVMIGSNSPIFKFKSTSFILIFSLFRFTKFFLSFIWSLKSLDILFMILLFVFVAFVYTPKEKTKK